ncbi:uncharacterized protein [Chelonus insularis]|uniref:uncharacterized protein n=1 Tax=Chelonus insularis TaxID=460826 RepID=UPI00158B3EB6|nr:uncharacterized protein LOC118073219 [Chelonus insularis]
MKKQILMERLKRLHDYRQELVNEEETLKKLLSQLQEQVHVLQVEQFHLAGLLRNTDDNSSEPEEEEDPLRIEELDLKVPTTHTIDDSEEEEEQD